MLLFFSVCFLFRFVLFLIYFFKSTVIHLLHNRSENNLCTQINRDVLVIVNEVYWSAPCSVSLCFSLISGEFFLSSDQTQPYSPVGLCGVDWLHLFIFFSVMGQGFGDKEEGKYWCWSQHRLPALKWHIRSYGWFPSLAVKSYLNLQKCFLA